MCSAPSAFSSLLAALGVAAGLEADNPKFGREVGLIITGLFVVLPFLVGGFIAAWTADLDDPESSILHGFLVWALFVVLVVAMVALGAGSALGSAGQIFNGGLRPDAGSAHQRGVVGRLRADARGRQRGPGWLSRIH